MAHKGWGGGAWRRGKIKEQIFENKNKNHVLFFSGGVGREAEAPYPPPLVKVQKWSDVAQQHCKSLKIRITSIPWDQVQKAESAIRVRKPLRFATQIGWNSVKTAKTASKTLENKGPAERDPHFRVS